jgi:phosphate transport system protein
MLHKSLDAMVDSDAGMAREVLTLDDEVDEMHRGMFKQLKEVTKSHPEQLDTFSQLLTISRNLERIADLATNIAEDVIYLIEGRIVRHQGDSG